MARACRRTTQQAVAWYRKAADQGYAIAQTNLGVMYDNGQGVAQDYAAGRRVVPQGRRPGVRRAQANLGVDVRQRPRRGAGLRAGRRMVPQGRRPGVRSAQDNLGMMYARAKACRRTMPRLICGSTWRASALI